jgi:hypothetical protein
MGTGTPSRSNRTVRSTQTSKVEANSRTTAKTRSALGGRGPNPDVEIHGRARIAVQTHGVATDEQILNAAGVE